MRAADVQLHCGNPELLHFHRKVCKLGWVCSEDASDDWYLCVFDFFNLFAVLIDPRIWETHRVEESTVEFDDGGIDISFSWLCPNGFCDDRTSSAINHPLHAS